MGSLAHKHFQLDQRKIKRAQRLLGAVTERETIERALDEVIAEREKDRRLRQAHDRFMRSGIQIKDVFGKLAD